MTNLAYGVVAGLTFGTLAALSMGPMSFPDKRAAISSAFVDRFAIGLVIGVVSLPWPSWVTGLVFGALLSLPSAIITKAWRPIIGLGALGGTIIGALLTRVVQ